MPETTTTTLGTKPDLQTTGGKTSGPAAGGFDLIQMLLALGIVAFLLKVGLPKLVGKFGKRLTPKLNSSIEIEESAAFGAGNLNVVTVRGRTLLLAVTQSGVSCLADLTEPPTQTKKEEPAAFFELLDRAQDEPVTDSPVFAVAEIPEPDVTSSDAEMTIDQAKELLLAARSRIGAPTAAESPQTTTRLQDQLDRLTRLTG